MRECQALGVVLPRNPVSFLDEVLVHAAGKRYRAAEAKRAEPQKIDQQLCERTALLSVGASHRLVRRVRCPALSQFAQGRLEPRGEFLDRPHTPVMEEVHRGLSAGHVMEGVAAAFGLANLVGTVIAWRILSRRMRGLYGRLIAISLVRMHLAAIPGAIFALAVSFSVGVIFSPGPAFGIITVIIGGSGALLLYVLFSKALGVNELTELGSGLRTRLRR